MKAYRADKSQISRVHFFTDFNAGAGDCFVKGRDCEIAGINHCARGEYARVSTKSSGYDEVVERANPSKGGDAKPRA
jgi:hypothetical protein